MIKSFNNYKNFKEREKWKRKINIYSYTMKKFKRMDAFLTKIDKIEV